MPCQLTEKESAMNIDEIKKIAKQHGIKAGKATKSELIRLIQQTEGNPQCYNSNSSQVCGQDACLWREDCV